MDEARAVGGETAPEGAGAASHPPGRRKLGQYRWETLREYHQRLVEIRWQPPAPMELPVIYPKKNSGLPKLSSEEVKFCRENVGFLGCTELAKRYDVSRSTMWNIVKGFTYRELNGLYPPQR